jgi:hypothetical protein
MEHICSVHKLLLAFDAGRRQWYCQWPGCTTHIDQTADMIQQRGLPGLTEVWQKITYDVKYVGSSIWITAHLPAGFTMPEFTKVYNLDDAKDYDITPEAYIERMKERMFEDLLKRIKQPF